MTEIQQLITSVRNRIWANVWLKSALVAATVAVLAFTIFGTTLWAVGAGVLALAGSTFVLRGWQDPTPRALALLHRHLRATEYSLDLLANPAPNVAEQLQLARLARQLHGQRPPNVVGQELRRYALALAGAVGLALTLPWLKRPATLPASVRQMVQAVLPASKPARPLPPSFGSARVQIVPPTYTQLPTRTSADLNVAAPAGSGLTWTVSFSDVAKLRVRLADGRGSERPFARVGAEFQYRDRLAGSGLYAIRAYWQTPAGRDSLVYQSDFYKLDAQPDQPPVITPDDKQLYRQHRLQDPAQLRITARVADDYRVARAFIVATVARGAGENVKFRELQFPLALTNTKDARLAHTLDLNALKFAPGDELYYYWAAVDNRQPEPNLTKSDTYFIVFKDTARADEAQLATMAVNLMPEYFRSQRQIIIDTEKLIARRGDVARGKLAQKAFNATSNEIGFDQKVLRLRYGQYLGEEFETSIGGHDPNAEGDVHSLEGFMHKHDTDPDPNAPKSFAFKLAEQAEKAQAAKQKPAEGHGHAHGSEVPGQDKDPLAALMEQYVHGHDDGEANTFYEQSTRSLLKMALEQMWQSELHLRLYEPEKALPFEQKALEYLKEAQQRARTFVKKTGFDPPPLKEKETRLTGKLNYLADERRTARTLTEPRVAALAAAVLGYVASGHERPNVALPSAGQQAAAVLARRVAEQPTPTGLPNWVLLGGLQRLASGARLSSGETVRLKAALLPLAQQNGATGPAAGVNKPLARAFWRRLR